MREFTVDAWAVAVASLLLSASCLALVGCLSPYEEAFSPGEAALTAMASFCNSGGRLIVLFVRVRVRCVGYRKGIYVIMTIIIIIMIMIVMLIMISINIFIIAFAIEHNPIP